MTKKFKTFEPPLSDCHWSLLLSSPARGGSLFRGGESMLRAWVDRSGGRFIVRTGKLTPMGFAKIKRLDSFDNLTEAQEKAKLANYIFEKCAGLAGVR